MQTMPKQAFGPFDAMATRQLFGAGAHESLKLIDE